MPQKAPDEMREVLSPFFAKSNHHHGIPMGLYLGLPGLVGFWPMSSVQRSTGAVYDISNQSRTLTYNGNPTFNIYNNIVPYIDLDGTGDYLSRADETDLDILGTESIYASSVRGLTVGAWVWDTAKTNLARYVSKGASSNYNHLVYLSTDNPSFSVSNDGATLVGTIASSVAISASTWYFVTGRFTPSTETAIFVNDTKSTNTTSIPASLFNGTAAFVVGGQSGGVNLMTGRVALVFLCANALPDDLIYRIYYHTKGLFGL